MLLRSLLYQKALFSILFNTAIQDCQLMHLRNKNRDKQSMETFSYTDEVFYALADHAQLIKYIFVEW